MRDRGRKTADELKEKLNVVCVFLTDLFGTKNLIHFIPSSSDRWSGVYTIHHHCCRLQSKKVSVFFTICIMITILNPKLNRFGLRIHNACSNVTVPFNIRILLVLIISSECFFLFSLCSFCYSLCCNVTAFCMLATKSHTVMSFSLKSLT